MADGYTEADVRVVEDAWRSLAQSHPGFPDSIELIAAALAALAGAGRLLPEDTRTEMMTRLFDAESALAELVRLKDGPRDEAYERGKPIAWSRARAVLAQIAAPGVGPWVPVPTDQQEQADRNAGNALEQTPAGIAPDLREHLKQASKSTAGLSEEKP